ncbi:hypothetical protein BKA66DRAFT_409275 [Pyrenochaeta sp. MPI-SDFR-AT-0127]|nr:hypothetical protein BKA66DRAFT_409275 [Pyrenochaeta sp. MPI-SDFR-AT-0127]
MSLFNRTLDYITDVYTKAPSYTPLRANRVDANMQLIQYHESSSRQPTPTRQETNFLPHRTRLTTDMFSELHNAQTHAYYEEICTIPAASLGQDSKFRAGHLYIIHPLLNTDLRDLSTLVLQHLQNWIETVHPNDLFIGKAQQVLDFKKVRSETLEEAKRILERRELKGEVGREEGFLGSWELIDSNGETDWTRASGQITMLEGKKRMNIRSSTGRYTDAALEEAAEAGRKAAEEAKIRDEYEFVE